MSFFLSSWKAGAHKRRKAYPSAKEKIRIGITGAFTRVTETGRCWKRGNWVMQTDGEKRSGVETKRMELGLEKTELNTDKWALKLCFAQCRLDSKFTGFLEGFLPFLIVFLFTVKSYRGVTDHRRLVSRHITKMGLGPSWKNIQDLMKEFLMQQNVTNKADQISGVCKDAVW